MNKKIIFLLLFFSLLASVLLAQQDSINPNGYNVFYYPNGFKLSEGYLKNGKPDGYWVTYYVNGKKKSEGNRKNFMLDSLWIFYAENGDTTETIYYAEGKKNGFYTKYYTRYDTIGVNRVKSKELYVDDKRQGYSYYYYPTGELHYKIKFKDNYKYGTAFEYAKDGRVIAIEEYRYNNLVSRTAVNRYDKNGNKTGKWIEVFDNGKIKSEINYVSGLPNGSYKEFSPSGKIIKLEKFENGKVITKIDKPTKYDTLEAKKLRIVKDFYDDGKLKAVLTYNDSVLYGLQIYYNRNGSISKAEIYNEIGIKTAEGLVDTANKKQGNWTMFDDNGNIISKGAYENDKKNGKWTYFYPDGSIMQIGEYEDDKPVAKWLWYYQNGKLLREENYIDGLRNGLMYELDIQGDTIVKGSFADGFKDGKWFYKIGDEYSVGKYFYGKKTGQWLSYYYPEMRIKCKTNYMNGLKSGKHKCWYPNKRPKEVGEFMNGNKNGLWTYYRPDGAIDYTAEYVAGKIVKVNDMPLK